LSEPDNDWLIDEFVTSLCGYAKYAEFERKEPKAQVEKAQKYYREFKRLSRGAGAG
jgi:hypothetical protein